MDDGKDSTRLWEPAAADHPNSWHGLLAKEYSADAIARQISTLAEIAAEYQMDWIPLAGVR